VTAGAIRRAINYSHIVITNKPRAYFYRLDALPVARLSIKALNVKIITFHRPAHPSSPIHFY